MDDTPRRSILAPRHDAIGATFVTFAGWQLPLSFAGTVSEHVAVRDHVGMFDVSHLGLLRVSGTDATAVVAAALTNDPARLEPGTAHYTLCCDDAGGIVDDLVAYRVGPDEFVVVPNAANTAAVRGALDHAAAGRITGAGPLSAQVDDETGRWAIIAVQGPEAARVIDRVVLGLDDADDADDADDPAAADADDADDGDVVRTADVAYLDVLGLELGDTTALLARTGYTGEPGVELIVPASVADDVWDRLLDAGVPPCGLGARDTLRLEMGYPLHGNDLSRAIDPYMARLGWAVALDRGPFRGRDALVALRAAGPARRLWGVRARDRRPLRAGLSVLPGDAALGAAPVGVVTSGGYSPTAGVGIGLALLDVAIGPGDRVGVDVRGRLVDVEVVRPPFVARDPRG